MDPIDLDTFRATRSATPPAMPKRSMRARQATWFLKGPISGDWLQCAAELPGRALHVALAVRHGAALARRGDVRLTGELLRRFGVKPDAGRRGLAALERAGLVAVQRHAGRCPIVSIRNVM